MWFRKSKPATIVAVPQVQNSEPPLPAKSIARKVTDVFGTNAHSNPESYVERDIERDFIKSVDDPGKVALVVYGISKQGKTSLLRHVLARRPHFTLEGSRSMPTTALYRRLLNECGVVQEISSTTEKIIKVEGGIEWFKLKGKVGGSTTYQPFPIDISDPSAVAAAMRKATNTNLIVLDNFHYLDAEVQRDFATAIRTFEKYRFKFVVIGTWTKSGYIQNFNSDLMNRVKEFSFGDWEIFDLRRVLDQGSPLLNVTFAPAVRQSLIDRSAQNVSMLQDLTKEYLYSCNVTESCAEPTPLKDTRKVEEVERELVASLESAVTDNLCTIASIGSEFLGKTRSYWIIRAYLGHDTNIINGLNADDLFEGVNEIIAKEAHAQRQNILPMHRHTFTHLVKNDWLNGQLKSFKTPILIFNEATNSLIVCDSCTKFVLRQPTRRGKISKALEARVRPSLASESF